MKKQQIHHIYIKVIIWMTIAAGTPLGANADVWWVSFHDKAGTEGDITHPEQFLSTRAIERRQRQGIRIDSLDLPVSRIYQDSLQRLGAILLHTSRWHNGISIETTDDTTANLIAKLDFVKQIQRTQRKPPLTHNTQRKLPSPQTDIPDYGYATLQAEILGLPALHQAGFRGAGIHIAVVDDGFYNADVLSCFDAIRTQITGTRDFVKKNGNVYTQGTHGSMVLSCLAAQTDNYQGSAPDAYYYLFRTEDDYTESLRETDAQVAAFELADSIGADIITTSLGYAYGFDDTETDLTYQHMNGKSQRNSTAATIAARKGLVVCVAMGNEGNKLWHYLTTPADADSILSVGSVTANGESSPFSSYGPTADGRIKPEICALGSSTAVINPTTQQPSYSNGTSFATPIIAGMAACLWNAMPELTNMQLIERIIQSASQYPYADNQLGYGIPNAWKAYNGEQNGTDNTVKENDTWLSDEPLEVWDLQGRKISTHKKNLTSGLYLLRQGTYVKKIFIP